MPGVGIDVMASVGVTVNWDAARRMLGKDGVQYDAPVWQDPGPGPFPIYDDIIGGSARPVGSVTWSTVTKTVMQREADAAGTRTRWVIVPTVQLFRQVVRSGAPQNHHCVYTASATVYGEWS